MLPSRIEQDNSSADSNLAKISNSLIESFVKKNNLGALKILFYISRSAFDLKSHSSELITVNINLDHMLSFCNIDSKTLRRNVKQMQETVLTFVTFSDEGFSPRLEEDITVIPYLKFDYSGKLELKMFSKVLSLVSDVKNKFTVINLENLMKLRSKHSVRMIQLLELIDGFSDHIAKRKTYTLSDLNGMFGTSYSRLKEFERKILVPVKIELDDISTLSYVYQLNYSKNDSRPGRPVASSVTIDLVS